MISICEFCGNEKEVGDPTPFHGSYCAECMRMNIDYDKESIAKMKPKRRKKISETEFKEIERQKDEALDALINYGK